MYMGGRGIEKDYVKAFKWLNKAALQNDPVALHNLGVMYLKGYGVLQDEEKGEDLIERATTGSNNGIIPMNLSQTTKTKGATLYNS